MSDEFIPISQPSVTEAEKRAVLDVLESGILAQGERVAELERHFADLCGTRFAVATSSGTTALHLALLAHGISPGDEVITSSFTFVASANSVLFTGAKPVFADIEADTFNLDPERVEAAVTDKTRAIMPVHLFGHPCDMDPLLEIAERHDLLVIEDAAQAVGAEYRGRPVGSFGTGVFSLYATKNAMSAEGGIITCDDEEVLRRLRLLRNHGMERRYEHEILGYNFRMSDVHAAIGVEQVKRLSELNDRRRENAAYLNERLQGVTRPQVKEYAHHVWHQYTVRLPKRMDRDRAVDMLRERGVGTGVFYPVPVHHQAHMKEFIGDVELHETERAAGEVLSLPVHPGLSRSDLGRVVEGVNSL